MVKQLDKLATNPCPDGCKKLHGVEHSYRIRVGDYRVIYTVFDNKFSNYSAFINLKLQGVLEGSRSC
ncbi:MAG: type II toxin-antitoxin system RelE family toxin [Methylococcales bacterium]